MRKVWTNNGDENHEPREGRSRSQKLRFPVGHCQPGGKKIQPEALQNSSDAAASLTAYGSNKTKSPRKSTHAYFLVWK
ncbi:hypothetical protein N7468_001903 [Penicillium chermesinum]|uniref:Uncharacterized protein n=1 Tax=Penicillium chermesinum TaxID=63820 RepID=A0A9W9PHG3_9EURO|nr:uncharacterized protein N7468_001903 [Penicillium chermesinum]KAJ5246920.1 hypothetical protein N7468_001903 [Penicillium chermesinum]